MVIRFIILTAALFAGTAAHAEGETPKEDKSILDSVKDGVNSAIESETAKKAKELGEKGLEHGKKIKQKVVGTRTSRNNREDSFLSLFYIPLNYGLVLPAKSGYAGAWLVNESLSIELEYLSASYGLGVTGVDLVDLSERLMMIKTHWYPGNSFNFIFGLGQRKFNFSLGNDMLAKITDANVNALPSLKVQNEVISLGIGNRWQFDNGITFGFDWAELIVTVGQGRIDDEVSIHMEDEKDRDRTKDVLDYLRYGPTFNAVKLHVGYTF